MENRFNIIKKYISARENNQIDNLLELFTNNAQLYYYDGTVYEGKSKLKNYYELPQSVTPSISIPKYEDGEYYIILSFLMGVKKIKAVFYFNDNDLIRNITLSSVGWI